MSIDAREDGVNFVASVSLCFTLSVFTKILCSFCTDSVWENIQCCGSLWNEDKMVLFYHVRVAAIRWFLVQLPRVSAHSKNQLRMIYLVLVLLLAFLIHSHWFMNSNRMSSISDVGDDWPYTCVGVHPFFMLVLNESRVAVRGTGKNIHFVSAIQLIDTLSHSKVSSTYWSAVEVPHHHLTKLTWQYCRKITVGAVVCLISHRLLC